MPNLCFSNAKSPQNTTPNRIDVVVNSAMAGMEVEFDETVVNQFSCKRCDRVSIGEICTIYR